MENSGKKQHIIGLILLSMTAIFWGAGFVLNAQLVQSSFFDTPSLLLTFRFFFSALCLLVVFNKKIRFNKYILLYGGVGGIMLFAAFLTQTIGQKYTTPSHSGFFTASYAMFVPFISWIAYKKRPHWMNFLGVAVAVAGLALLNLNTNETGLPNMWIGDILTIVCALLFALQIFWTDYSLKKEKIDCLQLTFWQIAFGAVLFALYTVIFESKHYNSFHIDIQDNWWRLLIVIFGGTAFAYYAQTFSQQHLTATETSLIMACESPIGAFLSMILLIEPFSWQTIVGGALVIAAVVLVEVVPTIRVKRKKRLEDTNQLNLPPTTNSDEHEQNNT